MGIGIAVAQSYERSLSHHIDSIVASLGNSSDPQWEQRLRFVLERKKAALIRAKEEEGPRPITRAGQAKKAWATYRVRFGRGPERDRQRLARERLGWAAGACGSGWGTRPCELWSLWDLAWVYFAFFVTLLGASFSWRFISGGPDLGRLRVELVQEYLQPGRYMAEESPERITMEQSTAEPPTASPRNALRPTSLSLSLSLALPLPPSNT